MKGSTIALLGWAFINDSDGARKTPAGAEIAVHDLWVETDLRPPSAPGGLLRDLAGVLAGADAAVVFTGHKEYRGLEPERVKGL